VASPSIHKYYVLALILIHMSPADVVYNAMQTPLHPLKITCRAVEAIDAITTLCSSFEKAKIACPNAPYAPYTVTLLTALGGSIFRYLDKKQQGHDDIKPEWSKPTGTIERAIAIISMYSLLRKFQGQRFARGFVVLTFVFLNLYNEIRESQGLSISKPFVQIIRFVQHNIKTLL
jgi:hypothetical protein